MRRLLVGGALAVASVVMVAGPAFAGEITGNGKPTQGPAHANSFCVFSGHNDDPSAPLDGSGPNGPGGHSQSYGQDVKLGLASPHELTPGIIHTPGGNIPGPCRGGGNPDRQK